MSVERLKDTDRMPFGEHEGKRMQDVPAGHLVSLDGKAWLASKWPQVQAYIDHNRKVLSKELEDPDQYGPTG